MGLNYKCLILLGFFYLNFLFTINQILKINAEFSLSISRCIAIEGSINKVSASGLILGSLIKHLVANLLKTSLHFSFWLKLGGGPLAVRYNAFIKLIGVASMILMFLFCSSI